MGATTPNLSLYKPGGGSSGLIVPDERVDVDRINDNMDKIDVFAGTQSSFRTAQLARNQQFTGPTADIGTVSGVKLGDYYQETDVDKRQFRYNGTTWILYNTDWISLGTLNAPWSVSSGVNPFYRVISGALYLDGRLAASAASGDIPFQNALPVAARPSKAHDDIIHNTSANGFNASVSTAGVISISHGTAALADVLLSTFKPIPLG